MPRERDSRSQANTGNDYSRKRRRDEERYHRDRRYDDHDYRRRDRSRSPERRHRDKDYRGYRDYDDRYDDRHRSERRDQHRERRSPKARSPVREDRRRDRDHNDSRDHAKKRREDKSPSRPTSSASKREDHPVRPPVPSQDIASEKLDGDLPKQTAEDKAKVAERQSKLEAWKAKQAAQQKKKADTPASSGNIARDLFAAMDRKAAASGTSPNTSGTQSPATIDSPAPYAGKFDPKAIAKKAAGAGSASATLGNDVVIPTKKPMLDMSGERSSKMTKAPLANGFSGSSKAPGKVSRFGIGPKLGTDADKPSTKNAVELDEEERKVRTLEKLPTPLPGAEDPETLNDASEEVGDDGGDEIEIDVPEDATEEEAAEAARVAAEKRQQRLQEEEAAAESKMDVTSQVSQPPTTNSTAASSSNKTVPAISKEVEMNDDEIDPLDAFMMELGGTSTGVSGSTRTAKSKAKSNPAEAFLDNDEYEMDAVGEADNLIAVPSKNKRKELPKVDHSKIEYEDFRKDFYTEPPELAEMSDEDVQSLRFELDGIKVRGTDVPKPVSKWSQCALGAQTLQVINQSGFERPTSIQAQSIPAIMKGRDVIGIAKTGSGKTLAYLLPMFRHIKYQRPLKANEGPIGLILAPTRELATQIHRDCKPYLKLLDLKAICAYGGTPIKEQIAEFRRGAEIVVCTVGRMIDILAANSGRVTNLRRVTYVVLDEADRMFDMGLEPQVMRILTNIRPQRQCVMFSATFPKNMEALARKTLKQPVEIVVGGRSVVAPEITQIVEVVEEEGKFRRLLALLGPLHEEDEDARTLVFVDRQERADSLLQSLLRKGYPCVVVHGGMDQFDRDSNIADFKSGAIPVMVATSVAARGLDVKQLKLVVNYDSPNHLEDYVHRAGRTGRAGNTGTAVTFIKPDQERYATEIAKALQQSNQPIPDDVSKLRDAFWEKVKAGTEKRYAMGFGGRGVEHLEAQRESFRQRERNAWEGTKDSEKKNKDEAEGETNEPEIKVVARDALASTSQPASDAAAQLNDSDIKVTKRPSPTPEAAPKARSAAEAAMLQAKKISERIGKGSANRNQGPPADNKAFDAGAFQSTLEINDLPQRARWAVTNRSNVAKILESTGVSITTKGSFYPPGKELEPGQEKLYILVEGDTEPVVIQAMRELKRLATGAVAAANESESRGHPGRYTIT